MTKCTLCGNEFDKTGGWILMDWCRECIDKPTDPPSHIEQNGILIPNPENRE